MAQYTFKKDMGVDVKYDPTIIYDVYRVEKVLSTKKYRVKYIGMTYPLFSKLSPGKHTIDLDIIKDWYPLDADKFFENTFE